MPFSRPNLTFKDNFESFPFDSWPTVVGRITQTDEITPREGSFCCRVENIQTDAQIASGKRSELNLDSSALPTSPYDQWFSFSVYIPSSWIDDIPELTDILAQWHSDSGNPPIAFGVSASDWYVQAASISGGSIFSLGTVTKDVWTDFVFHITWSTTSSGLIEIWNNGTQKVSQAGVTYPSGQTNGPFFKCGNYKWPWNTDPGENNGVGDICGPDRLSYLDCVRVGNGSATYADMAPDVSGGTEGGGVGGGGGSTTFGTKFILPFNNDLDDLFEVYFDYAGYTGGSTILEGADDTVIITNTAADDDPLGILLGSECQINILVDKSQKISIKDFNATEVNQIRITVFKDQNYNSCYWQGFISVEDNNQPLLDPPFILSVKAVDGIGLLKGEDLVDTSGSLISGNYSIIEWIGNILYKTGQTLNIRTYFPYYNNDVGSYGPSFIQDLDVLSQIYIDSTTFVQGDTFNINQTDPSIDVNANAGDDAYTALTKICTAIRCRLFQEDGCWHLKSIGDYLNPADPTYFEYKLGEPIEGIIFPTFSGNLSNGTSYDVNIGKGEIVNPVNDDATLYLKQPTKWVQLNYSYDQGQFIICNATLAEGVVPGQQVPAYTEKINSLVIDPSGTVFNGRTSEGNPIFYDMQTFGYGLTDGSKSFYCFQHGDSAKFRNSFPSVSPVIAPSKPAFIRVVNDILSYEYQRYIVIKNVSTGGNMTWIKASSFKIDSGDRLKVTFDWRTRNETQTPIIPPHPLNSYPVAMAVLRDAQDGTLWTLRSFEGTSTSPDFGLNSTNNRWVQIASIEPDGITGPEYIGWATGYTGSGIDANTIQWANVGCGITAPVVTPVSGTVDFYFLSSLAEDDNETWIKNISIERTPFIAGSYNSLNGDYNFSGTSNNSKKTESETIYMSDSPKRWIKGALLKSDGSLLNPPWKRAGITEGKRFTQLMEQIMFTLLSRTVQKIEGTFLGLEYIKKDSPIDPRPNGLLNYYYFVDTDTPSKRYMCTSFEKHLATAQWRGVFVETLADLNTPEVESKTNLGNSGTLQWVPSNLDNHTFNYLFSQSK